MKYRLSQKIPANVKRWLVIAALPMVIGAVAIGQVWDKNHPFVAISMTSILVVFLLWYRLMCQTEEMKSVFNGKVVLLSGILFVCGLFLYDRVQPHIYGAIISLGFCASFFVFISFREALQCAWSEPRPAIIAVIALLTVYVYGFGIGVSKIANATILIVRGLLSLFGIHSQSWTNSDLNPVVVMDDFSVVISPGCCGMTGIFLFFFLLSVIRLLDWRLFSRWPIFEFYAWGFLYMFLINALRITAYLLFSHWVGSGATEARELFHSWIGFGLDFVALSVFITAFYAIEKRRGMNA